MPSWSHLSLLVAAAAALVSAEPSGRSSTHRINIKQKQQAADKAKSLAATSSTAPTRDVIVEMFQWSWDSVAQECTNFLGPAGYGYVQGTLLARAMSYGVS